MKIFAAILVCGYFLFSFPAFPQPAESPGQYPFVTYTTKDGLISNRVRKIYQDSSGRLFFLTYNGLSIYDAERFTNYSTEDGLGNGIINDVMQMGKDSFWIIDASTLSSGAYQYSLYVNGRLIDTKQFVVAK